MVDYSRWDSLDVGDSSDEETTTAPTSILSLLDTARALEKNMKRSTRTVMRQLQGCEETCEAHAQRLAQCKRRQAKSCKDLTRLGKSSRRLAARNDTVHQNATRTLLFASEADIDEQHEKLKENEKLRSQIVAAEARRRSVAASVEETRVELMHLSVEHSSIGAELAESGQHIAKQCQQINKQTRSIRVNAVPSHAALRDFCRSGRAHAELLATCEQTQAVIAKANAMTVETEEICRGAFLGCVECGAGAMALRSLAVCGRCKLVHYCCREHQLAGWSTHKAACRQQGVKRAFGVLEHLIEAFELHAASA